MTTQSRVKSIVSTLQQMRGQCLSSRSLAELSSSTGDVTQSDVLSANHICNILAAAGVIRKHVTIVDNSKVRRVSYSYTGRN